ncbi:MAG TPA: c-type cytochrome biogenesis protein CcmI, partial [Pyrinomonadaceae bacterium]|nr:c-type cytochrome biogenesis protein CcmI [Pyrinomonadaceae bacterium]
MSFWIFAGLMTAMALCYVLPPLLQRVEQTDDERERSNVSIYRDQFDELERDLHDGVLDKDQYEQGRLELQRRLLEDVSPAQGAQASTAGNAHSRRATALILGGMIPLLAVLLYFQIGTPQAITQERQQALPRAQQEEETMADASARQPGAPTQQEIEQRVSRLAARLKENPEDVQGWLMLARSYYNFKRYREASDAYARAVALSGNDAGLWADYAESLALANDSQLQGQPLELINRALQLDPNNQKALWLAGNAAFQTRDFQQAISYWEKLRKLLPEGSEGAQSVSASIEEARA